MSLVRWSDVNALLMTFALLGAMQDPEPPSPTVRLEPPASPLPTMAWDAPVLCAQLEPTPAIPSGEYRAQCDDVRRVCLLSPARELDAEGQETQVALSRVQPCSATGMDFRSRAMQGWRFVPAVAEAPAGWIRDERGRVMQFNFDLNRRVYLGGAWAPLWIRGQPGPLLGRSRADFGIQLEFPDRSHETLFRIRMLEGEFFLGDSSGTLTAFRYDWSRQSSRPIARVTTFIGPPTRFDIVLNIGGYLETLTFDTLRREGLVENRLLLATAQPTFDLWHSRDLVSYVRVRAGPSGVLDTRRRSLHAAGAAALEGDVTVDRDGFHHLRFTASAQKLFFTPALAQRRANPHRVSLRAEYEVIVIAINDQPLSLLLDGRGGWRDDVEGRPAHWEWSAGAGLRFSLWAPPRRGAAGTRERP
jgi:hypothetical protein